MARIRKNAVKKITPAKARSNVHAANTRAALKRKKR